MGQNFSSEPVVEKETERDHNDIFNVAVSSCQGWRMSQEDNHSLMLELPGEHKAAFFAVFDGHGSAKVSKHASEGLWRHLTENDMYIKGNFKEALEQAFLTFDREVNESYNAQLAGTTAVCILIANNIVYCANIGDSRGVASVNCECVPLSYDHKPENPQELKRILAAGGYVLGNRVNGNLALSRAFGDFHYKGNEQLPPEQQIVSPCPDVKMLELNDDVDFLVLACDGIWDVLSSEEVVEFVTSRLEQNMEPGLICEQLTTRCLATDYELVIGCDNMTVLLVCYTRGRSWVDFCTDIFDKNSKKLGVPRTRPTIIDENVLGTQDQNTSGQDKPNEFYDSISKTENYDTQGTEETSRVGDQAEESVEVKQEDSVMSEELQLQESSCKLDDEPRQQLEGQEQLQCSINEEKSNIIQLDHDAVCRKGSQSDENQEDASEIFGECKVDLNSQNNDDAEIQSSEEACEAKNEQVDTNSTIGEVDVGT